MNNENDNKIKEKIIKIRINTPNGFLIKIKNDKEILNYVYNWWNINFNNIKKQFKLRTILYMYLNNMLSFQKCKTCGKEMIQDIIDMNKGFNLYCCRKCSFISVDRNQKISNNIISKSIVEKQKIQEKTKKTCLKKYGCEYSFQSENNKQKTIQTNLIKYGCKNPLQNKQIKEKVKKTLIEKYGVENAFQYEPFKQKIYNTNLKKYGFKSPMQNEEIKKQSSLKSKNSLRSNTYDKILMKNKYDLPCFSKEFYIKNISNDFLFNFKCKKCGTIFQSYQRETTHRRCPKCYPKTTSIAEHDIADFLRTFIKTEDLLINNKQIITPYELDIICLNKKIAIEYDGLYWHSFENYNKSKGNKNYHLEKTINCEQKGLRLIHIFEDEWQKKKDIVKSRLKSIFNHYDYKLYARTCTLKEINYSDSQCFLNQNHLQGSCFSKINLGLFHKNDLISLMTFRKISKNNNLYKNNWELLRFCNKLNYQIIGSAGKMLKYFEQKYKPEKIISYADRRWSQGNLYYKLGFKLDHINKPNYWYIDKNHINRYNKMMFQKHLLNKKLLIFDKLKTEYQNMINNGYETIYDCGNYVFVKTFNTQISS